jgi:hypothetical protein
MNLVKAQQLAKEMPQQELEKFANGFAPHIIPPWLATGEMQAKMQRAQQLQAMQGAAQGPQPSVKEQIEQKAGLMGLQQAQQRMSQQQQMTQRPPPGPIPEGTPEPDMQPSPEMMMASSGGLAQMPVNFNYDGGGIVAFSGEDGDSEVDAKKKKLRQVTQREMAEEYNRKRFAQQAEDEAARSPEAKQDSEGIKKALAMVAGLPLEAFKTLVSAPGYGFSKDEAPAARPAQEATAADMGMPTDVGMPANTNMANLRQPTPGQRPGLPQALPQGQSVRPTAQQAMPTAQPAAAMPNIPGMNDPAAAAAVAMAMKAPNQSDLIAEDKARREAMGVTGLAGEDQAKRIQAARDLYEKSKPSGLDDLIRVFGQAGQSKGLSGLGPAYTAMQTQKRAEDVKMQQQEMEQQNLIDTARRSEGIAGANKVADILGKLRDTSATTGASVLGHQMQGNVQLANQASSNAAQMQIARERNLNSLEVARIQAASANRPGETERLMMQYGALKAKDPQAAEVFMSDLERIKTGSRSQTAQEALSLKRQGLVEKNEIYKNASQQYYFSKDPTKKAQGKAIMDEIERKEGIISGTPSNIQSLVDQYAK